MVRQRRRTGLASELKSIPTLLSDRSLAAFSLP
jgi:hypothetical protein